MKHEHAKMPFLVIPAQAGIHLDLAKHRNMDYALIPQRALRATDLVEVRSGIPGSSPGQALPAPSGLRRNDAFS